MKYVTRTQSTMPPRPPAIIGVMTGEHVSFASGYAQVVVRLARQALAIAVDAAPHRAREGERRWPMARALPAARVLIGVTDHDDAEPITTSAQQLVQTLAHPQGSITDGFGHSRPIYRWLALHLVGSAARLTHNDSAFEHIAQAARLCIATDEPMHRIDPRLAVWRELIAWQHGLAVASPVRFDADAAPSPLVPLGLNDLIDAWTYNELLGLHGLHLHALLRSDSTESTLTERVHSAALYHLGHTQPDYTTYQPWGLSAFASDALTAGFAEQQLHDVATHLSLSGPGGAVLPALLLADASATMAGTLTRAWSCH